MKGPKIIVFHIRQLLKTAAFVLAGLLIIFLLIWVLAPKEQGGREPRSSGQSPAALTLSADEAFGQVLYIPGSYSSVIVLDDNNIYVTVTVDAFSITDVRLTNMAYAQQRLYPLFTPVMEQLRHDILLHQTTRVEPPEDGPQTGLLLLEAINIAIGQAFAHTVTTGL
ncbi:MAG: hypothetical protein FWE91_12240 [Defluviitaleaceae bacterium]|nr:hypothetical protein [Defluviitaleaceae bacterium]MCL2836521.1 hypothetical protein [Defluviitaleaceae bacterium]